MVPSYFVKQRWPRYIIPRGASRQWRDNDGEIILFNIYRSTGTSILCIFCWLLYIFLYNVLQRKKSKNFGIFSLDCSEIEHSFAIFFRFIFFIFSVFRFQWRIDCTTSSTIIIFYVGRVTFQNVYTFSMIPKTVFTIKMLPIGFIRLYN